MIHGPNSSFSGAFSIGKKPQGNLMMNFLSTWNIEQQPRVFSFQIFVRPDHYNLTTP